MYREKRRNKIIIFILVGIICLMGAGYAAFNTQLNITGVGNISGEWSVRITNVEVAEEYNGGTNKNFSFQDTTAELEADLYNKGDYVTYNVTVANEGDFDAKLETLGLEQSTNEAVLITTSGLVKGETLLKGQTATLTVKIEYNANYSGDATGTSGIADITLDFVQNSGGTIIPTDDYLVTYDYTTNGGTSTNAENAYLASGEAVNLNYTAAKESAEFLGWNTNPQAGEGLIGLSMPSNNITLYAIFKDIDTTPPTITNISTTSTINSITVVTTATEDDGEIDTYEYSIDNGNNWVKISGTNSYTFTGLKSNTEYSIMVRVRNKGNTYVDQTVTVSTKQLNKPTFVESATDTGKTITIVYPEGEGLNYEYQKDGGSWTTATRIQEVEFTANGTLVARVSDGTNTESATYTVSFPLSAPEFINSIPKVTSGDGLYADSYESNVYTYRGSNPNNYVTFNGEQWRIISINTSDNTIKIIRNEVLEDREYDAKSNRTTLSSQYCNYSSSYGCNIYGSTSTLYNVSGTSKISALARKVGGTAYSLPTNESSLSTYLNNTYYEGLSATARSMVKEDAVYKAAPVSSKNISDLNTEIGNASQAIWKGKVGLIDLTEYMRATTGTSVSSNNWMHISDIYRTMSPYSHSDSYNVWHVNSNGSLSGSYPYYTGGVRPVLTLSSEIQITGGSGTSSNPYTLGI